MILFWEGTCLLEGRAAQAALLCGSADFLRLEGCRDGISHLLYCIKSYLHPSLGIKLEKGGDLTGACSPITLPVTVGLGGSMAVALNALTSIPATGGGGRLCARGPSARSSNFRIRRSLAIEPLLIHKTLFPCSRPRMTPGPGDHVSTSERRVGASTCSGTLLL